ncbi:Maltose O-acetyltransferase [Limihaloglobus sulfuriphilus]|uniref:Maltose O-acetyltransferase n=1 Tax=Limihaloglobus sulfuriphilus TaxID=1851148 RepID=A0A1Q2MFN4_9BACT|nr:acyltransferase [Limihaloglobus sulfuriphilus]AQQ71513.1 Maltose O-acetyltransferase [Limihaloglobus sulfuriphilus]
MNRNRITSFFRSTWLWKVFSRSDYKDVPLRRRFFNWIIHRCVYGKKLPFSYHFTSLITRHENFKFGRGVESYLANAGGCYIQAINGVEIGDDTIIAPGIRIISANHNLNDYNNHDKAQPIRIGNRCWLGTNCIILPGVELADNVIVAAGSVVTKSFSSNCVIAGTPAKVIKKI